MILIHYNKKYLAMAQFFSFLFICFTIFNVNSGLIFDTNVYLYLFIFITAGVDSGCELSSANWKPRAGADSTVFLHEIKKMWDRL